MVDKDIVRRAFLKLSAKEFAIGAMRAIGHPIAGETIRFADCFGSSYREKKLEAKLGRLEKVLKNVQDRVRLSETETAESTGDAQDMFFEVIEALLADDESGKAKYYEAILLWQISENPPPLHIRVVVNAVKPLSAAELDSYLVSPRKPLQRDSLLEYDTFFWTRLEDAGLASKGARVNAGHTAIAKKLMEYLA